MRSNTEFLPDRDPFSFIYPLCWSAFDGQITLHHVVRMARAIAQPAIRLPTVGDI
jgi:hypothetical protein